MSVPNERPTLEVITLLQPRAVFSRGISAAGRWGEMHGQLERSWAVEQLAKTAALSRSAFFERFTPP